MDFLAHNRRAWNKESSGNGRWSTPVSSETINAIKNGDWHLTLSPNRAVPSSWLSDIASKQVLCLASSGGQQAPKIAATGASVVSFDLSEVQLEKDRFVAQRDNLDLQCVQGDMANLSVFPDKSFDVIIQSVSNVFVPDVQTVWQECNRVLKIGGSLMVGFMNPSFFLFDHDESERSGKLEVKYKLPFAEPESLDAAGLQELDESQRALEFSHSLEDLIGGQIAAGFLLSGLYEDDWDDDLPFNKYSPSYLVTKAEKVSDYKN